MFDYAVLLTRKQDVRRERRSFIVANQIELGHFHVSVISILLGDKEAAYGLYHLISLDYPLFTIQARIDLLSYSTYRIVISDIEGYIVVTLHNL